MENFEIINPEFGAVKEGNQFSFEPGREWLIAPGGWGGTNMVTLTEEQQAPFLSGDPLTHGQNSLRLYEIWTEGFSATGEYEPAHLLGWAKGETFEQACANFRYPCDFINEWNGEVMVKEDAPIGLDEGRSFPSIFGCQLFDNEQDARRFLG